MSEEISAVLELRKGGPPPVGEAKRRSVCGISSVVCPFAGLLAGVLVFALYPDKDQGWNALGAIFLGAIPFLLSTIVGLVFSIVAFVRKEPGLALRIIGLLLNGFPVGVFITALIAESL